MKRKSKTPTVTVELTVSELNLLVLGLDAHAYEASDEQYRSSGFVDEPGSDDPDTAASIAETNALHDKLERILIPMRRVAS